MQRYFSNELNDNILTLKEEDLYHITKVMRMNPSDQIEVVFDQKVYLCVLVEFKQKLVAKIISTINHIEKRGPKVNLIIPILKEQKMDYIFQKATELGVNQFTLVSFDRSLIKINDAKILKKRERWKRICKEASEQSKRNTIPEINFISTLSDLCKLKGVKLVCSTTEKNNYIKKLLKKHTTCDTINLVIGPEGGISDREETLLESLSFTKVTLGPQILRVETVPLYLMSIIHYEYWDCNL